MKTQLSAVVGAVSALLMSVLSPNRLLADDTEIFFAAPAGASPAPNLLVILDNSRSAVKTGSSDSSLRLEVVKGVIDTQLAELHDVNVGLMVLNADQGGRIVQPVAPIDSTRPQIRAALTGIRADASPGFSEALFEAYNYWAGLLPRYTGSSPAARFPENGPFQSPLDASSCTQNHLIFVASSAPAEDTEANDAVTGARGFMGTDPSNPARCSAEGSGPADGVCLDDIARLLRRSDLDPATAISEGVATHVIEWNPNPSAASMNRPLLRNTAEAGGGTFSTAANATELAEALNRLVGGISAQKIGPLVSPLPVQSFNQAKRQSDLYFAVFEPAQELHWAGNLKKFRLRADGTIVDAANRPAIDASGTFSASSRSYWSQATDGASVRSGGAASRLPPPAERRVYTDAAATPAAYPLDLTGSASHLSVTNALITPALLGLDAAQAITRDELIEWARGSVPGREAVAAARHEMGDPLHARPALVSYGDTAGRNHTVVFVATNDGYLHAIDAGSADPETGGDELWSFIPGSMLKRMANLQANAFAAGKGYGLDGTPVAYRLDRNDDGRIDTTAGDRVYLFLGMGRGGSEYYALDITEKDSPRILWRRGRDELPGLGQSWSAPVISRVRVADGARQNSDHLVMLIGGGYDVAQDSAAYQTDTRGNRLYMLDAVSGELLWHAGPAGAARNPGDPAALFEHPRLTHSMPAALRVVDLTGDGYADRVYAADTGGQVWRFDIHHGNAARAGLVSGGVLASLGNAHEGSHPVASSRRFFTTPDVSLLRVNGQLVMNVAIGSGYRAHPLETRIEERFYSLHDPQPLSSLEQAIFDRRPAITESQLEDVTTNPAPALAPLSQGWMIRMSPGEKVLSDALTFEELLLFTTFTPVSAVSTDSRCIVRGSQNRLYTVNATDGSPVVRETEIPARDVDTRHVDLKQGGIAGSPSMLFPEADSAACSAEECSPPPVCLVGTEQCGIAFTNPPVRTYWQQKSAEVN